MTKILQALLTGMFFTFFIDFFIFLGILLNYINFYEINVYYNILFVDNQNIYLFFLVSAILGFLVIYINKNKISIGVIGLLSILAFSTIIPDVGHAIGEMLFKTKNTTLQDSKHTYHGDIYYYGRKQITFYDYELKKTILLNKKDLK